MSGLRFLLLSFILVLAVPVLVTAEEGETAEASSSSATIQSVCLYFGPSECNSYVSQCKPLNTCFQPGTLVSAAMKMKGMTSALFYGTEAEEVTAQRRMLSSDMAFKVILADGKVILTKYDDAACETGETAIGEPVQLQDNACQKVQSNIYVKGAASSLVAPLSLVLLLLGLALWS
uniref:Uncharacterized protein n=1 Tax=Chromera velia CCMP2878 TaxID=1169474 RepID=A0A0G4GFV7_9ALVE|mmetsp:Transcript_29022/g.56826  ORF Transcript_29022/g.56826 Transcript_29022/m.56826 type:complete len:176 (-) Transcript_29022:463-990(-)|eukprot:Cvel_21709.t1-p1 / transcript=Cvel_21709.t1 / gene=Cvel_21709 / organism=Chromera_velia_CCMP2878 / gene_product=hypothetical protein / transcript_product=hypothetical protein / location=Cvel_scaffold2059:13297-13821(+) / protein_length=175 / sequence_SO=supercontig / SO=protein_coding / is_pseudo=false